MMGLTSPWSRSSTSVTLNLTTVKIYLSLFKTQLQIKVSTWNLTKVNKIGILGNLRYRKLTCFYLDFNIDTTRKPIKFPDELPLQLPVYKDPLPLKVGEEEEEVNNGGIFTKHKKDSNQYNPHSLSELTRPSSLESFTVSKM